MSLETLLEAAKYVEYQSEAKARGEEPHDYTTFSKLCSLNSRDDFELPDNSEFAQEANERRRFSSRESPILLQDQVGGGTREVHNKLEKNRRAHLKECFEALKKQLPHMDDRKTSNLSILRGAIRFIQILKRKEREYEHEMERLAREKIAFQQRLSQLKKDISNQMDNVEETKFVIREEDNETTTTASECGVLSDFDDETIPEEASSNSDVPSSSMATSIPNSVLVSPAPMHPAVIKRDHAEHFLQDLDPLPIPAHMAIANSDHAAHIPRILPTMPSLFPHTMQVISQPQGIKVITNTHPIQLLSRDSPLAPPPTSISKVSSRPHLTLVGAPLPLPPPPKSYSDMINQQRRGSVLSTGNVQIAMKGPTPQPQNMIATLHMSKPQVIQSTSGIITQGSQVNNGTIGTTLRPLVSGIAHMVAPSNHHLVSVVSHAGPSVLKAPVMQPQYQPLVKPMVVVSVPGGVASGGGFVLGVGDSRAPGGQK